MPLPRWLARVNRRVFNPREIRKGRRSVLTHVGRSTGREYITPMDAHPVEGGFVIVVMYGSGCDWVRNVMAAGTARLRTVDGEFALSRPRLLTEEQALSLLPEGLTPPPRRLNVTEYLLMDTAG